MNDQEKWIRWEPAGIELDSNYHFDSISDNEEGFAINISRLKTTGGVNIIFQDSVWAYKRTYESFRQNLFSDLSREYGHDFYTKWSFFKVENSRYLKWLSEQSNTVTDHLKLTHFVIMTVDDIVDVVASYEPEINFINSINE